MSTGTRYGATVVAVVLAIGLGGCGETFLNLTASLGGSTAGGRGTLRVLLINNTPHRAVLTAGTFDPEDRDTRPDIVQFALDDFHTVLEGDGDSGMLTITCGRVFGIGSPELLGFTGDNLNPADIVDEALVDGVQFYSVPDGEDAAGDPTLAGSAAPFEALVGVDFACESLLIIRFESNDAGGDGFRIDFETVPSESTR